MVIAGLIRECSPPGAARGVSDVTTDLLIFTACFLVVVLLAAYGVGIDS
jgi:hypothetical protein